MYTHLLLISIDALDIMGYPCWWDLCSNPPEIRVAWSHWLRFRQGNGGQRGGSVEGPGRPKIGQFGGGARSWYRWRAWYCIDFFAMRGLKLCSLCFFDFVPVWLQKMFLSTGYFILICWFLESNLRFPAGLNQPKNRNSKNSKNINQIRWNKTNILGKPWNNEHYSCAALGE